MYSKTKARRILKEGVALYKKRPQEGEALREKLLALDAALKSKERVKIDKEARELESFLKQRAPKSFWRKGVEFIGALAFALVFATIVRQMWFEPMEIPTGSMRPTFREQDRLIVSKTPFGINIPLTVGHFYFDPTLVQHNDIIIFTVDNMEVRDPKTAYFYLFPGYRRFVKRCLGKPGDTLYFYGGRLYGIDKEGKEIAGFRDPQFSSIDHIPFISFEGMVSKGSGQEYLLRQMNLPLAKITLNGHMGKQGEIFNGKEWILDRPQLAAKPHAQIVTYSDFWGMRNYAMARLLRKEELPPTENLPMGKLYLELRHTPSLTETAPSLSMAGRTRSLLHVESSYLPLQDAHLDALWKTLYTARFVVKNGYASAYHYEANPAIPSNFLPRFPGVPNGCYEFYFGKAYSVGFGGRLTELRPDHPLLQRTTENLLKLFNMGISFLDAPASNTSSPHFSPNRFAFFKEGALHVMNGRVFEKNDSYLEQFVESEKQKQAKATPLFPYIGFVDHGPPVKENGQIDGDFIKTFGVTLPEKGYLALGDNYAMSADSREFGFVPEENLEGTPFLLLWPPGRWGWPFQPHSPWITLPNIILGILILLVWGGYAAWRRWYLTSAIYKS